jgi:hypothetical protein
MRSTAFLWQPAPDGGAVPAGLPPVTAEFTTVDEFKTHVRALLVQWLAPAPA